MSRMLVIVITFLIVVLLPACDMLPKAPSGDDVPSADETADTGKVPSPGGATSALRWGGTLLTFGGLAIVASRFMGVLTAPLIGGVLTVGTGIATLTLADLMSRFWWIGPLLLLGLIALAVIEYLNERDLLWREPPKPKEALA